jgi:hypothetical protein
MYCSVGNNCQIHIWKKTPICVMCSAMYYVYVRMFATTVTRKLLSKLYRTENISQTSVSRTRQFTGKSEAHIRTCEGAERGGPSFRAHSSPVRYSHKPRSPLPEPLMAVGCYCYCSDALLPQTPVIN